MISTKLLNTLFRFGLGELPILHARKTGPVLGFLAYDKGRLILKDAKLLRNTSNASIAPCFDIGIVGAVAYEPDREWAGLTFRGPELCHLSQDLSSTRVEFLTASMNEYKQCLIDFHGSVYRGYQLMLHSQILPVVLLKDTLLTSGGVGFCVSNLRFSGVGFDVLGAVHELVSAAVLPKETIEVDSVELARKDFVALFAQYAEMDA